MRVIDLAQLVIDLTRSASPIVHNGLPVDDPRCRRPDIRLAAELLGWSPQVAPVEGLVRTIEWQRSLTLNCVA